jgi:drug/metabolite transporter (DMT)-like permease
VFKLLSAIVSCLVSSPLLAAVKEMETAAPVETVDPIWVIVFVVVFFGSIIGFVLYFWRSDNKGKPEE